MACLYFVEKIIIKWKVYRANRYSCGRQYVYSIKRNKNMFYSITIVTIDSTTQ